MSAKYTFDRDIPPIQVVNLDDRLAIIYYLKIIREKFNPQWVFAFPAIDGEAVELEDAAAYAHISRDDFYTLVENL